MTDREKLVGLLKQPFQNGEGISFEDMAVHLLLHGVMVQQWISVEDRLPEDDQPVLCWYEYFRFGNYNRMYQTYGISYCINGYWAGEVAQGQKCRVFAWMPLPEPPKEEPQ